MIHNYQHYENDGNYDKLKMLPIKLAPYSPLKITYSLKVKDEKDSKKTHSQNGRPQLP